MSGTGYIFSQRILLMERLISWGIMAFLICMISPGQMMWLTIFLFYPHHIQAYTSRHRVRPYGLADVLRITLLAGFLFWLSGIVDPHVYRVCCAAIFLIHSYMDDIRLCGENPDIIRVMAAVPAFFIVLYKTAFFDGASAHYEALAYGTTAFLVAGFLLLCFIVRRRPGFYETSTIFFAVILCALYAAGVTLHGYYVFGAVVIFHGSNWLIKTGYRRWQNGPVVFQGYLQEALLINIFFVMFYIVFLYYPQMPLAGYLVFSPKAFATWGVVHSFSTFRMQDYRGLFSREQKIRQPQAA